jgi:hypothetical protein
VGDAVQPGPESYRPIDPLRPAQQHEERGLREPSVQNLALIEDVRDERRPG